MWISRRTDYATRALLALSLAEAGSVKLASLAKRTVVPESVLEQVMIQLRSDGLVRSERGPSGGYRLNKAPGEITLDRVVRLFQGPLAPIGCATRKEPEPCPMEVMCSLKETWQEVRDATIAILTRVTFEDLAARAGGPWRATPDAVPATPATTAAKPRVPKTKAVAKKPRVSAPRRRPE